VPRATWHPLSSLLPQKQTESHSGFQLGLVSRLALERQLVECDRWHRLQHFVHETAHAGVVAANRQRNLVAGQAEVRFPAELVLPFLQDQLIVERRAMYAPQQFRHVLDEREKSVEVRELTATARRSAQGTALAKL